MASQLHRVKLSIAPAVGRGAAAEFEAYTLLYTQIPDLHLILAGEGESIPFPDEPSLGYAVTTGLTARAQDARAGFHAFRWMIQAASPEWVQIFAIDIFRSMRARGEMKALMQQMTDNDQVQQFLGEYQEFLSI